MPLSNSARVLNVNRLLLSQERSLHVPMRGLGAIVLPFLRSGYALVGIMMPAEDTGCELLRTLLPHTRVNRPSSVHQTSLGGIMVVVERMAKGWLRWI
jgi:hypothetical protein